MLNNEEFIKRLEIILDHYGLTASSFADKIDVQRSSISHLLSGRNKPSLEFIMKIIHVFPEVDLYWILNGKGNFPKEETYYDQSLFNDKIANEKKSNDHIENETTLFPKNDSHENTSVFENKNEKKINTEVLEHPTPTLNLESEIEQIVIFYKNGVFKVYKPGNN